MLEKKRKEAEEAERRAAEAKVLSESDKIQRLFERLQLGKDESGESKPVSTGSTLAKNVSESWKFLFDEDDLGEEKPKHSDTGARANEPLDDVPGAAKLFPNLSDYWPSSSASSSTAEKSSSTTNAERTAIKVERWKDPRMKSTERDAFKALFSSLFEHKDPDRQKRKQEEEQEEEQKGNTELKSIFSNFNRTGQEQPDEGTRSDDTMSALSSASQPVDQSSASEAAPETPLKETSGTSDPVQVLHRQLENLSKRAEPIYLERKPSTPSFEVMKNTVGPHDWMTQNPTLPQDNVLFSMLREETQVAIRMRRELTEQQRNIIKVREFVDELIAPFAQPSKSSGDTVRPSSVSLDGLLAQAILAASSTRLDGSGAEVAEDAEDAEVADNRSERSLHPFMGHAMVEQARKQGLTVFIRAVRTESYKALIKSRWDAWHDGAGCLEILREMQRNGALMDGEVKQLVRGMRRDLSVISPSPLIATKSAISRKKELQQYGWGEEEEAAPVIEMLNVIKAAYEDGDYKYNMKRWTKRAGDPRTYTGARPA